MNVLILVAPRISLKLILFILYWSSCLEWRLVSCGAVFGAGIRKFLTLPVMASPT